MSSGGEIRGQPTVISASAPALVRRSDLLWVGGLCGIVFGILTALGHAVSGMEPGSDATAKDFAKFFADNRRFILISFYVFTLAQCFLVVFAGALWSLVRRFRSEEGWANVVLGAAVATAAVSAAENGFAGAAAYRADQKLDPQVALSLFDLGYVFYIWWAPAALFLASAALVAFRTGLFPRWLGWFAFVLVLLLLVLGAPVGVGGWRTVLTFLVFNLFAIWAIAMGVVLMRRAPAALRAHGQS